MKKVIITLSLSLTILSGFAQGFEPTATNFGLPEGGNISATGNNSFNYLSHEGAQSGDQDGSQYWLLKDMNGDAKEDLVVYRERYLGTFIVPGPVGSRYWKVYLNNGNGFEVSPIYWILPPGGDFSFGVNNSFFYIDSNFYTPSPTEGCQSWRTVDMNGDAKPDLVICGELRSGSFSAFGTDGNRYWKVHLNNGTGFETSPINYTLPAGGRIRPDRNLSYFSYDSFSFALTSDLNGSQIWYTMDMNGDAKPDLVVYREKWSDYIVPGPLGNRYWKVYLNNGGGFDASPINWTLPPGGYILAGGNNSYNNINNESDGASDQNGSQNWKTIDINGDNKLDLLVYREKQSGSYQVPGTSGNRYWKAYLNNGAGFDVTPTNWTLPAGGYITSAGNNSYLYLNFNGGLPDQQIGTQWWSTIDLNGDNKIDLVVVSEKDANGYPGAFGTAENRYWKVHLNNDTGFETSASNWALPVGGYNTTTLNSSYYYPAGGYTPEQSLDGSQLWFTKEMTGDAKPDLLVYQEKQSGVFSVPGTSPNRYWKVFRNNSTLSIADQNLAGSQITIYPNPLKDFSTISFDETQENTTLNIFDLTGKKVMTDTFSDSDYTLKKGNLQAGLYMLQLIDASKKTTTKKLVIQ